MQLFTEWVQSSIKSLPDFLKRIATHFLLKAVTSHRSSNIFAWLVKVLLMYYNKDTNTWKPSQSGVYWFLVTCCHWLDYTKLHIVTLSVFFFSPTKLNLFIHSRPHILESEHPELILTYLLNHKYSIKCYTVIYTDFIWPLVTDE